MSDFIVVIPARYFSRAPIPYCRDELSHNLVGGAAMRHHGIYAYRRHLFAAGPCVIERFAKLEQCAYGVENCLVSVED